MTFSITKPEIYTSEGDRQQAYVAQIDQHLTDLRNQATGPGCSGEERKRITDSILRLETEKLSVTHPVAEKPDERQKVIALAEELEQKGDLESVEQAKGIRQAIMQTEFAESQVDETHQKLAEDGTVKREQMDADCAKEIEDNKQTLEDSEAADAARQQS